VEYALTDSVIATNECSATRALGVLFSGAWATVTARGVGGAMVLFERTMPEAAPTVTTPVVAHDAIERSSPNAPPRPRSTNSRSIVNLFIRKSKMSQWRHKGTKNQMIGGQPLRGEERPSRATSKAFGGRRSCPTATWCRPW
jgi:hypothetical protein